MAREFTRSDRISSQMHRELADILRADFGGSELGMITVSSVEVSRDLSVAKAYVSFLASDLTIQKSIKRLNEVAPQIRFQIGKRMRMRVLPELRFFHDDSIERGLHMDRLINSLQIDPIEAGDPDSEA